jgi:hypothetical protein
MPQVVDSLYSDTAVHDVFPPPFANPPDSGFYPIYTLGLKNVGSESDTFTVQFARNGYGFNVSQFLAPGQTGVFRTPGPLSDTASPNAQTLYYSFFVTTIDSIPIKFMQPTVTVFYGAMYNGPEGCNSDPLQYQIDVNALHK